ncbi:MAG: hypothetical protein K2P76_08295 [Lachnospiraceae bacterium]|nr:hypothetical protein [Lachnospiraceae bacterium]MDE6981936.1 hypothetical protein [Lachnospiraceae bacterium]
MRNWKLSRKITLGIMLIVSLCMGLLYMIAHKTLKRDDAGIGTGTRGKYVDSRDKHD